MSEANETVDAKSEEPKAEGAKLNFRLRRSDPDAKCAQAAGHLRSAAKLLEMLSIGMLPDQDMSVAAESAYEHVGQAMTAILDVRRVLQ